MLSEEGKRVKKQLEDYNQAKRKYYNLQAELEFWKNLGGSLKSSSFEQRTDGGVNIPYAALRLLKIEEIENLISETIDDALKKENLFLESILTLDPLSQNLLWERYITGKSLKKIIQEFNYCDRHLRRFMKI